MTPTILLWNVRELGNIKKRAIVKDVISRSSTEVILLQETKLGRLDKGIIREIYHFSDPDGVSLHSIGASGGI